MFHVHVPPRIIYLQSLTRHVQPPRTAAQKYLQTWGRASIGFSVCRTEKVDEVAEKIKELQLKTSLNLSVRRRKSNWNLAMDTTQTTNACVLHGIKDLRTVSKHN